jgi:WD40 repeat protein
MRHVLTFKLAVAMASTACILTASVGLPAQDGSKPPAADIAPPRLDVHGVPLPRGAVARLGTVRLWQVGRVVYCVARGPDGKTLALAGGDNLVHLWDVVSGREIRALVGHQNEVNAVVFAPDGKALLPT